MSVAVCREFFDGLYGDSVTTINQIVIWSPGLSASWCDSIDSAARLCVERAKTADAYFGFSLQSQERVLEEAARLGDAPVLSARRGYASTATVVPGIALDFDHDTPARGKKKRYPPDREAVLGLIQRMPLVPTFMIGTGGGIHAHWCFREPFVIDNEEEREKVSASMRGWNALARMESLSLGFEIDSVYDLARVLRPPGTVNRKPCFAPDGMPVEFFGERSEKRYNLDEFDPFVAIPDVSQTVPTRMELKGIVYDANAIPAEALLHQSMIVQEQFRDVWEGRRTFASQSELDCSLCFWAIKLGWPHQETVNLVIASRRRNGAKAKLRPDYFEKTISRAAANLATFARGGDELKRHSATIASRIAEPSEIRPKLCRELSKNLYLPEGRFIRRVVKFGGDPPDYRLEMEDGSSISLGGVEAIVKPNIFQTKVAAAISHVLPNFTRAAWLPISQAILDAAEYVELPETSDPAGAMKECLREYLDETQFGEDRDRGCQYRSPFLYSDGVVAISLRSFRGWLDGQTAKPLEGRNLERILWQIGCERKMVGYTRIGPDKRHATRSVYLVPMKEIPVQKAKPFEHEHAESNGIV
jgi:hypothetical protein